jgi:hypothetical protein
MQLMVTDLQRTGSAPDSATRGLRPMHARSQAPIVAETEDPTAPAAIPLLECMAISRRPGTSLLEATLAVALLGTLVLSTIPVVHGSRAASRRAIAVIETAVLAEYLASAAITRAHDAGSNLNNLPTEGEFDPPFHGFHWTIEPADRTAADGTIVVTVYSKDTSTALVVAR